MNADSHNYEEANHFQLYNVRLLKNNNKCKIQKIPKDTQVLKTKK